MNELAWNEERVRNRTLLIVEGNHEKQKLFERILTTFPEINISKDNILIYKSNVYNLMSKIVDEYGCDWEEQDIDLPFLISKGDAVNKYKKRDFSNIFLIFDYERHDPYFSELGIIKMQTYFSNSEDVGKLYINYPMVESYMDLNHFPDAEYINKKVSSKIHNGRIYKNSTKGTIVSKLFSFPAKIKEILTERFNVDNVIANQFVEILLTLNDQKKIEEHMNIYLYAHMHSNDFNTFKFQLFHIIDKLEYTKINQSYNEYMRFVFKQIAIHNISKALRIQSGECISTDNVKQDFKNINDIKAYKIIKDCNLENIKFKNISFHW